MRRAKRARDNGRQNKGHVLLRWWKINSRQETLGVMVVLMVIWLCTSTGKRVKVIQSRAWAEGSAQAFGA